MNAPIIRFLTVGILAAVLVGCASTPATSPQVPQTYPSSPPATATTTPAPSSPSPREVSQTPPSSPAAAPKSNPPSGQQEALIQKGEILVTKQEYQHTLSEVRRLVDKLNAIIASQDYTAWLAYLTPEYVAHYSDPSVLAAISQQPVLKRQGVQLSSIRDYFLNVVVPSRADARVQDLDFMAKDHVQAITIIGGKRYILYDLRLMDGAWKIGLS